MLEYSFCKLFILHQRLFQYTRVLFFRHQLGRLEVRVYGPLPGLNTTILNKVDFVIAYPNIYI